MKQVLKTLLISALLLGAIAFFGVFAVSDFQGSTGENIWQTKPWRPVARAAFGFTMIILMLITAVLLLRRRKQ